MAFIEFENVGVDFAVYNASSRSLRRKLIQVATGGELNSATTGHVVVRALRNLTFRFEDGDRVGLLGHNGAGKSTMLRLLSGVYEPSTGIARREGEIGSLIDLSLGIDPEATGRENIFTRGALLGMPRAQIREKMDEIIEFSELGDFIDMPLRTYSSGMHLRLGFAVSTIVRPDILLMDEWLSVGDEGFRHRAEARLNDMVASTRILVLATHSHQLVLNTCNRVLWLEHGQVRMDGAAGEVSDAYFKHAVANAG